ncbi:glycine-rich cell wall structural protein-like [Cryptomeria japonica]|uniref:glycine-rich cell wall structural protein-like n=1 Tax=Cryptomeria japonica TaxID=3369 RepID=UPI0027DA76CC|nr:glycine-rich cell wall structural protein-like [Cryptomeria japonica]
MCASVLLTVRTVACVSGCVYPRATGRLPRGGRGPPVFGTGVRVAAQSRGAARGIKPRPERTRARSGAEGRPGRRAGGAAGDAGAEGGGAAGRAGSCTGGGAVGREGAPRRRCSRAGTGGGAAGREAVGGAGVGAAAEGGSACCGRCLVQSAGVAERAEGTAGRRGQTAHGTVDGVYGRCQARSTASAAQVVVDQFIFSFAGLFLCSASETVIDVFSV